MSYKIDFTTFTKYAPVQITGTLATNTTTYQQLSGTYTLPADGLYFLTSNIVSKNSSGTTRIRMACTIRSDNTTLFPPGVVQYSQMAPSNQNFATANISTMFFGNKDEVIAVYTFMEGWTGGTDHYTTIQRIW